MLLKKLRIKFICINMGIVVAMLAIIFGLVISATRQNLERESVALMQSALANRGRREPWRLPSGETRKPEDGAPPEIFDTFLPCILVELAEDGSIRNFQGWYDDSGDLTALDSLVEAAAVQEANSGVLSDYGLRFLRDDGPPGTRYVFTDMTNETTTLRNLARTSLLIGGASLVVFFVISLLLACWAVRPVEEAWKQQKQFVSDASHELKTPLTVIMTNAELLQSRDYDETAKRRFSDNVLTMARQMRGLVESLLELARVENGAAESAAAGAEVDFSRLCEDAILPFEPVCFEKGMTLKSGIAQGVRLRGSESHLRQVVEIFLDNAQKYADPGSEIDVSLTQSGSGRNCRLCVADRGAPISEEDLKHLFERFYRADKSRSRDGSYGLGLSIAQKIVESHHGKIWAESRDGINRFFVTLPTI